MSSKLSTTTGRPVRTSSASPRRSWLFRADELAPSGLPLSAVRISTAAPKSKGRPYSIMTRERLAVNDFDAKRHVAALHRRDERGKALGALPHSFIDTTSGVPELLVHFVEASPPAFQVPSLSSTFPAGEGEH